MIDEMDAAVRAGDYDAVADFYEDNAIFAASGMGVAVQGRQAIKETMEGFRSLGEFLHTEIKSRPITMCGDFAVANTVGVVTLKSPEGETIAVAFEAKEVMRKGVDGNWRYVADVS